MATAREYFEAAQARLDFLEEQRDQLRETLQAFHADAERLDQLLERTWRDLVGYLLPDVDDEELAAVEERLAYPMLVGIKRQHEAELKAALARREALGQLDYVAHSEIKLAGLSDELMELAPANQDLQRRLPPWEDSRWFMRLDARGFFTDGYRAGLVDTLRNWRDGSFLMAELEKQGVDRFSGGGDLRDRYRRLRSDADTVMGTWKDLVSRRAEWVAAKAEFDELQNAPQRFMEALYEALGAALRDHLEACPVEFRFELGRGDKHLDGFFRKLTGLDKQAQYLRELGSVRVQKQLDSLQQQIRKLQRKLETRKHKARRGRFHGASDAELEGLRRIDRERWARRQGKLGKLRTRIVEFDRWDTGSYGEHYLWWDTITRGAPGDDLYEVRTFHERWGEDADPHPHARLDAGHADPLAAAELLAEDMSTSAEDWSGLDDVS